MTRCAIMSPGWYSASSALIGGRHLSTFSISRISNHTSAERVGPLTFTEVAAAILNSTWSCGLFGEGRRTLAAFESAQLIGLDIDGGCSLDNAKRLFDPYTHIIATTRSHGKEKNGVVCDRFRVVLVLSSQITDAATFKSTYNALRSQFPFIDAACSDASRQFFPCVEIISVKEGGLEIPVIAATSEVGPSRTPSTSPTPIGFRGKLSNKTLRFLVEGAPIGQRHKALVSALMDFKQNLFSLDEVNVKLAHLELMDAKAWETVKNVYDNQEPKHAPRTPEGGDVVVGGGAEDWVHKWLTANQVAVSYSRVVYIGDQYTSVSAVLRKMRLDRAKSGLPIRKEELDDAFREWIEEKRRGHLVDINARIGGYDIAADIELRKFCEAAFVDDGNMHLIHEVMRHFIWQVKRKLYGFHVEYHLMPILYGPQGSGKTTAVNLLLAPLGDLVSRPNGFACVRDERQARVFIDYFCVFFDEMAQAERTDVNELKNYISSPTVEYRPMGTNDREKGPNVATLIGASNRRVAEIIMDDSGARRFFELVTPARCNWDALSRIDFELIWRAADQADDVSPIRPYWEEVAAIQTKDFRHKGPVEEWIAEESLVANGDVWTEAKDLNQSFNDWYGGGGFNATSFGRALKRLGITKRKSLTTRRYEYAVGAQKLSALERGAAAGIKVVTNQYGGEEP